jgi:YVTN family beta-propeller protein
MITKQKLCSIALASTAMILMLMSIAGGTPFVYITNSGSNNVSVIDTATNTVTATVSVGYNPLGVTVSPDGTNIYVANEYNNTVSVINPAANSITSTVNVENDP